MGHRLPGLGGEIASSRREFRVVGEEHAATRRGEDLVAVERECRRESERSGRPATSGCSQCLRGVGHDGDAETLRDGFDGVVVGDAAEQIHRKDGGNRRAVRGELLERALDQVGRHVARHGVAVHEVGRGPRVHDGVRGRREGHRGRDDHGSRTSTDPEQCQVQCGGAGAESHGGADAGTFRDLVLERVHVRPERRDPAGPHRGDDVLLLQLTHIG